MNRTQIYFRKSLLINSIQKASQVQDSRNILLSLSIVGLGVLCIPTSLMAEVHEQNILPTVTLDTIVITASALENEAGDMATATSIITKEQIEQQPASTLGDVLAHEAGVSADTFGQGASRPIIRGQTAPRVKIMQNGLTVQDASQISPDHQVSVPVIGAKQIEVIKGTSALMYGGGAIGGVVNVVDAHSLPSGYDTAENNKSIKLLPATGKVSLVSQHATDGYLGYAEVQGGVNTDNSQIKLYANVQKTDQGNIQAPHWDADEITNSWYIQDNATVGVSYENDNTFIGTSYQYLTSEYGLPFHVHNQCKPEASTHGKKSIKLDCNGGSHHHDHEHEHGEPPFVDLKSDVIRLHAIQQQPMNGIDKISAKFSYTDYQHDEIDEGAVGTTFTNKGLNAKIDAIHTPVVTNDVGFMKGIVGIDYSQSEFSAVGDEGYLPHTNSQNVGVYVIERLSPNYNDSIINSLGSLDKSKQTATATHNHSGNTQVDQANSIAPAGKDPWYIEFGARQDFQNIKDTDNNINKKQAGTSASIESGTYLTPKSQVSARVSHSQRLPASQELFANGAHLATNTWERGNISLDKESTNGVEMTYRYDNGSNFDAEVSAFYNQSQNYIYAKTQDLVTSGESAGFRLIDYSQTDANHYGGEAKARYYLNDYVSIGGFADLAIIELEDNSNSNNSNRNDSNSNKTDSNKTNNKYAPRLPAHRVGGDITAQVGDFDAVLSGYHRFEQDNIADFETNTPDYNMLDVKLVYHSTGKHDYTAMVQVKNILDELAYNHSSYLVEHVPLPERSVNVGVTYRY